MSDFLEKYRPKTIDEICNIPQNILKWDNKKNIILVGEPGTGKTSTANILLKNFDEKNVLFLSLKNNNESEILNKISVFSARKISLGDKYIFLDEVDAICFENQVKILKNNIIFIFACNDIKKISEKLKINCKIIKFEKNLKENNVINRLKFICKEENIRFTDKSLEKIYEENNGDIRSSISSIQYQNIVNDGLIHEKNIESTSKKFNIEFFENLLCKKKSVEDQLRILQDNVISFCEFSKQLKKWLNRKKNLRISKSYINTELNRIESMKSIDLNFQFAATITLFKMM